MSEWHNALRLKQLITKTFFVKCKILFISCLKNSGNKKGMFSFMHHSLPKIYIKIERARIFKEIITERKN
jgi:hypothetical protein